MKKEVTVNEDQKRFVIPCGGGYTCFGFENARRDTAAIASKLKRDDLTPLESEFGTLAGYAKYLRACDAWSQSVLSRQTWFTPGTDEEVANLLEKYRASRVYVRLFLGDTATGRDWCNEHDVVGWVGRSGGSQKVPLLITPDGDGLGGGAILTDCILRMIDCESDREIYRHPKYQEPNLSVKPDTKHADQGYEWAGFHDEKLVARFKTIYSAGEWLEFLSGRLPMKPTRQNRRAA